MIIPEGFAEITYRFEGQRLPNGAAVVFGVQNAGNLSATAVATAARTAATTGLMTNLNSGVGLVEVLAKLGPNEDGPSASATGTIAGGVAIADALAPNSAFLVTKNTARGGRRGKGRLFLPGVSETVVDGNGDIAPATATNLQAELTEWLGNLNTAGIPMVLLHGPPTSWVLVDGQPRRRPIGGNWDDVPNTVQSLALQTRIATQRRRLRS